MLCCVRTRFHPKINKLIATLTFVPQAVFLADFKQIKKIQCLPQSDTKALLNIDIEGAKQVGATPRGLVWNLNHRSLYHVLLFVFSLAAFVNQRSLGARGRKYDGSDRRILSPGKRHRGQYYLQT